MTTLPSLVAIGLAEEEIFVFNLSSDLMWPRGQRVIWHYEWISPCYNYPSCQVWWLQDLCKRRNFVFRLSCDLTWLRESCNIMGEFPLSLLTTLLSLLIIDLLKEEILKFQFVTRLHVTTWSECQVTSWVSSRHHKSQTFYVWWSQVMWNRRY